MKWFLMLLLLFWLSKEERGELDQSARRICCKKLWAGVGEGTKGREEKKEEEGGLEKGRGDEKGEGEGEEERRGWMEVGIEEDEKEGEEGMVGGIGFGCVTSLKSRVLVLLLILLLPLLLILLLVLFLLLLLLLLLALFRWGLFWLGLSSSSFSSFSFSSSSFSSACWKEEGISRFKREEGFLGEERRGLGEEGGKGGKKKEGEKWRGVCRGTWSIASVDGLSYFFNYY